jgi:hypothetical protein
MNSRLELLSATDQTIDDTVEHADALTLRGLLYFLTEDEEVLAMKTAGLISRIHSAAAWPTKTISPGFVPKRGSI